MAHDLQPKQTYKSVLEAVQALSTITVEETTALVKTAVKDGLKGLSIRGIELIQRLEEQNYVQAFMDEVQLMVDKGKIHESAKHADTATNSWREFFKFIGGEPDEERFKAFCALFMDANKPDRREGEAVLDLQLMAILRGLTAGQMHLLMGFMKVRRAVVGGRSVYESLADHLGYRSDALVNANAKELVNHALLEPMWSDQSGTHGIARNLLSDLGERLRERVERYENFKETLDRSEH